MKSDFDKLSKNTNNRSQLEVVIAVYRQVGIDSLASLPTARKFTQNFGEHVFLEGIEIKIFLLCSVDSQVATFFFGLLLMKCIKACS